MSAYWENLLGRYKNYCESRAVLLDRERIAEQVMERIYSKLPERPLFSNWLFVAASVILFLLGTINIQFYGKLSNTMFLFSLSDIVDPVNYGGILSYLIF